jgi:homoserine/homoserine lactone efflux protein
MSWDRWWLFVVTVIPIAGWPGINMLHILTRSVRFGFRRALWSIAGCLTAVLLALTLSAAGVGALLAAKPELVHVLRGAGAVYLVWLGVRAWRGIGGDPAAIAAELPVITGVPGRILYRDALFTGLANPKLILFAAAMFPQFIDHRAHWGGQFALLAATYFLIDVSWAFTYATGGRPLARWLGSPWRRRLFDRATGIIFIALGLGLVIARAHHSA